MRSTPGQWFTCRSSSTIAAGGMGANNQLPAARRATLTNLFNDHHQNSVRIRRSVRSSAIWPRGRCPV
jgi:hypothetical protein